MAPIVERLVEGYQLEGPHWDVETQSLYFVDIGGKSIHKYTPSTNQHTHANIGNFVSFIIPVEGKSNEFVIGANREVQVITWDGISETISKSRTLAEVDTEVHLQKNRFNDGKADPTGKLWAGTMGETSETCDVEPNLGTLYSFNKNGQVKSHLSNRHVSNGLAWTADLKTFFYIDTGEERIDRFDYDVEKEEIKNRQLWFTVSKHNLEGHPDGQTIDTEENLWIALVLGSKIIKIDSRKPETLLDTVELPAKAVTSLTFGGPNLDELYVTSSALPVPGIEFQLPVDGSLYRIKGLGAKGLPGVRVKL